ncbi:hypothetical protein AAW14_05125 [Streptomyces hygroscopicus]|nr:hypothetical protein [Streptomyces hygroscopicus]
MTTDRFLPGPGLRPGLVGRGLITLGNSRPRHTVCSVTPNGSAINRTWQAVSFCSRRKTSSRRTAGPRNETRGELFDERGLFGGADAGRLPHRSEPRVRAAIRHLLWRCDPHMDLTELIRPSGC